MNRESNDVINNKWSQKQVIEKNYNQYKNTIENTHEKQKQTIENFASTLEYYARAFGNDVAIRNIKTLRSQYCFVFLCCFDSNTILVL